MKMQRFGEALAGRGSQWDLAQDAKARTELERQKYEDKQRLLANLGDTRKMIMLSQNGDIDGVRQILGERIAALQASGGDPSHSIASFELLNANPQAWLQDVLQGERLLSANAGQSSMFGAQAGPKLVKTENGQAIYEQGGRTYSQPIEGYQAAPEEPKDTQPQINTLRGDVFKLGKEFRDVERSYGKLNKAISAGTAAGDLSAIFAYMKMIDPGSTVREGEMATAKNAAGVPQRVVNLYNAALAGEMLSPQQREDFKARGLEMFNVERNAYDKNINNVLQQAEADGIAPERVLGGARYKEFTERRATVVDWSDL